MFKSDQSSGGAGQADLEQEESGRAGGGVPAGRGAPQLHGGLHDEWQIHRQASLNTNF